MEEGDGGGDFVGEHDVGLGVEGGVKEGGREERRREGGKKAEEGKKGWERWYDAAGGAKSKVAVGKVKCRSVRDKVNEGEERISDRP